MCACVCACVCWAGGVNLILCDVVGPILVLNSLVIGDSKTFPAEWEWKFLLIGSVISGPGLVLTSSYCS